MIRRSRQNCTARVRPVSTRRSIQLGAYTAGRLTNSTISNNVVAAQGPGVTISWLIAVQAAPGQTNDGVVVADDYLDATGAYGAF